MQATPLQTRPPLHALPDPTHWWLPVSQQSPEAVHVLPGQQLSLVPPQATHVPLVHTDVPLEQTVPFDRQVSEFGSQHSLARLHMLPLQQI